MCGNIDKMKRKNAYKNEPSIAISLPNYFNNDDLFNIYIQVNMQIRVIGPNADTMSLHA